MNPLICQVLNSKERKEEAKFQRKKQQETQELKEAQAPMVRFQAVKESQMSNETKRKVRFEQNCSTEQKEGQQIHRASSNSNFKSPSLISSKPPAKEDGYLKIVERCVSEINGLLLGFFLDEPAPESFDQVERNWLETLRESNKIKENSSELTSSIGNRSLSKCIGMLVKLAEELGRKLKAQSESPEKHEDDRNNSTLCSSFGVSDSGFKSIGHLSSPGAQSVYESQLQKLENDIRRHIRVRNKLSFISTFPFIGRK